MRTISQLENKIIELESELANIKRKYRLEIGYKSKYKRLYEEVKPSARGVSAKRMIKEFKGTGTAKKIIQKITDECFLSRFYVADLYYASK